MKFTKADKKRALDALVAAGKITKSEAERQLAQLFPTSVATEDPPEGNKRYDLKDMLKAPYRFVALDNRIARPIERKPTSLSKPLPNGYCAKIEVVWAAESPLLVGEEGSEDGNEKEQKVVSPIKIGNKYLIPGASLRGLIRSATEIIAFARIRPVSKNIAVRDIIERQFNHRFQIEVKDTAEGPVPDIDFVENIFGYVYESDDFTWSSTVAKPESISHKGRISFSSGGIEDDSNEVIMENPIDAILMGAHPTFAPFYLRGTWKDYGYPGSVISGRKRYLPRFQNKPGTFPLEQVGGLIREHIQGLPEKARDNPKLRTSLRFLVPAMGNQELRFTSTISLHNVSAEEIGAVLLALTHGGDHRKPYRHMLGRAKPFGAGQIRVVCAKLSVEANGGVKNTSANNRIVPPAPDECPSGEKYEGFCPTPSENEKPISNASHKPFLRAFDEFMRKEIGKNWHKAEQISEFLALSMPETGTYLQQEGKLEYLPDFKEFNKIRELTRYGGNNAPPPFSNDGNDRYLVTPRQNSAKLNPETWGDDSASLHNYK